MTDHRLDFEICGKCVTEPACCGCPMWKSMGKVARAACANGPCPPCVSATPAFTASARLAMRKGRKALPVAPPVVFLDPQACVLGTTNITVTEAELNRLGYFKRDTPHG